jgi:hypothetical protein
LPFWAFIEVDEKVNEYLIVGACEGKESEGANRREGSWASPVAADEQGQFLSQMASRMAEEFRTNRKRAPADDARDSRGASTAVQKTVVANGFPARG